MIKLSHRPGLTTSTSKDHHGLLCIGFIILKKRKCFFFFFEIYVFFFPFGNACTKAKQKKSRQQQQQQRLESTIKTQTYPTKHAPFYYTPLQCCICHHTTFPLIFNIYFNFYKYWFFKLYTCTFQFSAF